MTNSDCDSSDELIDLVFDWLKKEWADEIDFVVWTGDNVR
jgi:endopolyphosphatase